MSKSSLTGASLIGGRDARNEPGGTFRATDPASGAVLAPAFAEAGGHDVSRACALAWEAFGIYRNTSPDERAAFLESIAQQIEAQHGDLAARVPAETGLPAARVPRR